MLRKRLFAYNHTVLLLLLPLFCCCWCYASPQRAIDPYASLAAAFSAAIKQSIESGIWATSWKPTFPNAQPPPINQSSPCAFTNFPARPSQGLFFELLAGLRPLRIGVQPYVPFFFQDRGRDRLRGPEWEFGEGLVASINRHYGANMTHRWVEVPRHSDFFVDLLAGTVVVSTPLF